MRILNGLILSTRIIKSIKIQKGKLGRLARRMLRANGWRIHHSARYCVRDTGSMVNIWRKK